MRYINNGIEIQYKECQIARDALKELEKSKESLCQPKADREAWITHIEAVSESQELKLSDCNTLVSFLLNMPQDYYEAFSEYVDTLVKKGKGIDILVPYISSNGLLLLTVNRHDEREPREY